MTEREKLADRIDPRKRPDAFIVLDGKRYANWASADADLIAAADILRASPAAALCAAAGEIAQFLADLPRERRQNFPTFKASFATIIARHLSSPSTYAAGYAAWVEAATSAQPSTAENQNESAYQRGRFDGCHGICEGNPHPRRQPMTLPPIPMRLCCEGCGKLHIDEGEFATKPHHTHACQSCGMVWRPAVCTTVGVRFLPGFKNAEIKP
jgi:hypothetical protein